MNDPIATHAPFTPTPAGPTGQETFSTVVAARRSVYAFDQTPVPRPLIEAALRNAVQAPNHHRTEPWRFFIFNDQARAELARAYRAAATRVQRDLDKATQRAYDAPVMIVLACMPQTANPRVSEKEEQFAMAAAAQTLMLSFAAAGIDTLLTTGDLAESPEVYELVGLKPGEGLLMGVVNVGYRNAERPVRPRSAINIDAVTTWYGMST